MEDIKKQIKEIVDSIEDIWEKNTDEVNYGNVLSNVQDKLLELLCNVSGEHDFIFDMCNFWQHQYCAKCGKPKYPSMASQRCSELTEKMGTMTEEKYIKNNG